MTAAKAADGGEARLKKGGTIADLLAQSLNICFGELLAVHQALNPAVNCRDRGGLDVGRGQLCGHAPDVLHVGIHSGNSSLAGLKKVWSVVVGKFRFLEARIVAGVSKMVARVGAMTFVSTGTFVSPGRGAGPRFWVKIGQVGGWLLASRNEGAAALLLGKVWGD